MHPDENTGLITDQQPDYETPRLTDNLKHFTAADGSELWRNIGLGSV